MKRKHYEEEFKKEVVAAIEAGMKPTKAAERFHVPPPNITSWRKKYATHNAPERVKAVAEPLHIQPTVFEAFWTIAQALGPLSKEERERAIAAIQFFTNA